LHPPAFPSLPDTGLQHLDRRERDAKMATLIPPLDAPLMEAPSMTAVARFVALAFGLCMASFVSAAPPARGDGDAPRKGYAVPIGGALRYDNAQVWARLVELSGGPGTPWVVIATAAANPERAGNLIVDALNRQGAQAQAITVPAISPDATEPAQAPYDPALVEAVRHARGIFFAGGAQARITDTLQPDGRRTPLLDAIWSVFDSGGVVAGTSAGAAVMSTTMFRDAGDVLGVLKRGLRDGKEIDKGLGFVGPKLFVDQHFLKRGRIGRMLPLMVSRGYTLGIGVEENTAAIVHGDQIEVIGGKGALLVDLRDATQDPQIAAFNLRNARLTYLDRGDRYDMRSGVTTPSAQKLADARIDPRSSDFRPGFRRTRFYPDILGDFTIVNAMGNLLDSRESEAIGLAFAGKPNPADTQPDLGFEFKLRRGDDSVGWYTGAFGGEDYTIVNLYLDVTPVTISRPLYEPITAAEH